MPMTAAGEILFMGQMCTSLKMRAEKLAVERLRGFADQDVIAHDVYLDNDKALKADLLRSAGWIRDGIGETEVIDIKCKEAHDVAKDYAVKFCDELIAAIGTRPDQFALWALSRRREETLQDLDKWEHKAYNPVPVPKHGPGNG